MRILIIWGESLAKPGGGTTHYVGLSGGLAALGHEVTLVTPRYGRPERLHTGPAAVYAVRLPPRGMASFLLFQLLTVLALPLWLRRHKPDAVYVRTCFFQGLMALICRLTGRPLVGEVDSVVDEEILMRGQPRAAAWLIGLLDRVNNRLSSGLVCVTRGLREESIRRGGRPETTVAIPNGADVDAMQPADQAAARRALHLPEAGVLVGFPGTFAVWQGLDQLIEAAERLRDRRDLRLVLMGSGPMEMELRTWIDSRGLSEKVLILPPGDPARVAMFLNACDLSVVPIHDPRKLRYGLSVLKFWDAVSIGLPVLVPEGCELDDVLADLGLPGAFRQGPDKLAAAIAAVADQVEVFRHRRAEMHEKVKARYSWQCVAGQVVGFLDRLRSRRGSKP